ncbi:dienelactone hydrolase [Oxalobacteraceae bacterium CAVE-383]|nr:dienelactone hydrolase [Oxalobacteraceae bacterium CAVE-383]
MTALLLSWPGAGRAQSISMAPALDKALNEQVIMLPVGSGFSSYTLETTIFRPPGDGPFPLLLMNHGKTPDIDPHQQPRARYLAIAREFVARGYAVIIPMRKGFAQSTGTYIGAGCNIAANGVAQADDLQSALDYAVKQAWIDPARIIVAGQSHGGLATMAFGIRHYPGVRGLIDFAGGLRVTSNNCEWQPALVNAFAQYARKTAVPSLWFYGANDSYFGPELASRMAAAYTQAGGRARLIAYGPFKSDSHAMSGSESGVAIWWPETEIFLHALGMPTARIVKLAGAAIPPPSHFASLSAIDALPYVKDTGREGYKTFLAKGAPRAFAISSSGAWGYSTADNGEDTAALALARCQQYSKRPCGLYAVDDQVVWVKE